MLIAREISSAAVAYYLHGPDPGRWTPGAEQLLGLGGAVSGRDLKAVLDGVDPASGKFLPALRRPRRRAGWDLIFSAPKSVSLLLGSGPDGDVSVAGAHEGAVSRMVDHLEGHLTGPAHRPDRPGPGRGLIGARFEHRANAAGEPHLHTHLLVANLTPGARGWGAVDGTEWYVARNRLDALYHLALRRELAVRGWALEWRLQPDGRGDVASVPSAAIRAASSQGRLARAVGPYQARQQASEQPWRRRAAQEGWDPGRTAVDGTGPPAPGVAAEASGLPGRPDEARALTARVATRLAGRRSDFREADVVVALAASHQGGATPEEATAWAGRFCASSSPVPSPTSRPRWTTPLARAADDRLVALLEELRDRPGRGRAEAGWGRVTILASPPGRTSLLAQAEMIDGLRAGWERQGARVAVAAPDALAAARWQVLTGLPGWRTGARADVIIVDRADRRSTAELLQLAGAARRQGADLILAEGGTMPRLSAPASRGLAEFTDRLGRVVCPDPRPWLPDRGAALEHTAGPDRLHGLVGRPAAGALLDAWVAAGRQEVLVGLGPEEVRHLNSGARMADRSDVGAGGDGPAGFRAGDRVVALRSGRGRPAGGTMGEVLGVSGDGRQVEVRWEGSARDRSYDGPALAGLGPGWAVTPRLAATIGRPVMLLGPAEVAARLRPLVRMSMEIGDHDRSRGIGMAP